MGVTWLVLQGCKYLEKAMKSEHRSTKLEHPTDEAYKNRMEKGDLHFPPPAGQHGT